MRVRFAGRSQAQIEQILLASMRHHGADAAARYQALISAAIRVLQAIPAPPYSQPISREPGVRAFHLRHANRSLNPEHRVGRPRHLVLYRIADDSLLEVLGLAHDRMHLLRAARRVRREADER